ncbi:MULTISPECIES: DUF2889 domain-containing protein [unclassified Sphingobium]|uniref:DUF2889 domain-containing protein n=1 Tax=unclassified Sphingobium TaxID=2611147 RepID=UPI0007F4D580|nr:MULTISPECIES: DUF2889 domain-containing protein [unclassified Sphingobium]OAN59331.1 hypothetical protein A7Q26_00565 [Sphingobium sp. TCM1]WIW90110.1 DUF2889 domain-containing protein [Sphingobium sp. V4]
MDSAALDRLSGFRRRFLVTPSAGQVIAAVEDDYHSMAVILHHDGVVVTEVDSILDRLPWTTCPGASAILQGTFTGVPLADVAGRGEKKANCTHLHDLMVLAAAHATDQAPTRYEIVACDPVDGLSVAEIRRDGTPVLQFAHRGHVMERPDAIAGESLLKLREWIEGLEGREREAARLLQWGAILGNGRLIPMERQSTATRVPPNCYTFQPENAVRARRVGKIIDFSGGALVPLDHFDGTRYRQR